MKKNKSILLIIVAGLMWGTSGIFVHYLSPYGITAFQMTAIRGCVSVLAIGTYMLITARKMITRIFTLKLRDLPLVAGVGFSMFSAAACYYVSMQLTSIATSVILMFTAPLFVTCYSVIFLKEKLDVKKVLSIISIFVGCAFVSGVVGGIKMNFLGIVIGFMSAIALSAYNILTKAVVKRNITPISGTFYCYVFMSIFALLISKPQNIIIVAMNNSITVTLLMLGLGIFTFALPYFMYTVALKHVSVSLATNLSVIEALAATVYSAVLFKENLNVYQIVGIALIIGAVIVLGRSEE